MSDEVELLEAIANAAPDGADAVREPLDAATDAMAAAPAATPASTALRALQKHRLFDELVELAQALIVVGEESPSTRCHCAQGLVEIGRLNKAETQLRMALESPDATDSDRSEAHGLRGRIAKQRFLASAGDRQTAAEAIKDAVSHYGEAYPLDPAYHGANLVALIHRSETEGFAHGWPRGAKEQAEALLGDLGEPANWDSWQTAAAGEACLGLGDWDAAAGHYRTFAEHASITPFHLGSAARQLREVWNFDSRGGDPGDKILEAVDGITAVKFTQGGGELRATPEARRQMAETLQAPSPQLEAILGDHRTTTRETLMALFRAGDAVCQLVDRDLHAQGYKSGGTGFLVDGGFLRDEWEGRPLVVTNNHVLSEDGEQPSVKHPDAEALFDAGIGGGEAQRFGIRSLEWTSPRTELDVAIATLVDEHGNEPSLDRALAFNGDEAPFSDAPDDPNNRVYLVGHPDGRGQEFSLADNEVIDQDLTADNPTRSYRRIHYTAPTEPGMSGSPVLDARKLRVIGLHRAGGRVAPLRPEVDKATYRANEGVWVRSIAQKCRESESA